MPGAYSSFYGRFGRLRPIQKQAAPVILGGQSALIISQTASGKTEAVMAPLCERLTRGKWGARSVLVITPTRALVNDLFQRLYVPCESMRVSVRRKTGDHPLGSDSPEQIVITTPESTEAMLTLNKEGLRNVRAIVLDEIHLLDGTPRGDQLAILLQRIRSFLSATNGAGSDPQIIALSATVPSRERLLELYLPTGAQLVEVGGQRSIESLTILAKGEEDDRVNAAIAAAESNFAPKKVLVFVNSRQQVDLAGQKFRQGYFADFPVFGHHGNLSKWQREQNEQRFRTESRAVCVATTTLEVGIDIGDIDLVICMDPPFSIASYLQRVGRGCRRLQGKTRVLNVARDEVSLLMFEAIVSRARKGVPAVCEPPLRRTVLVQQVLAYIKQAPRHRRTLQQIQNAFGAARLGLISEELLKQVVTDMLSSGLLVEHNGVIEAASAGWDFIESSKVFANIGSSYSEVPLVDSESGKVVATVARLGDATKQVSVAGTSYEIVGSYPGRQHRVRRSAQAGRAPEYHVRSLPYGEDVGIALRESLGIPRNRLIALTKDGGLVLMTWLGKPRNTILCEILASIGIRAKARSFCVQLHGVAAQLIIPKLKQALSETRLKSFDTRLENLVDIGAHFNLLTEAEQEAAKMDWLALHYFRNWILSVEIVESEEPSSELGAKLSTLARV